MSTETPVAEAAAAAADAKPSEAGASSTEDAAVAEALKKEGNQLFVSGKVAEAVAKYDAALAVCPKDTKHLVYSNRSLALTKLGRHAEAVHDARRAVGLQPKWIKGFYRLGCALRDSDGDGEIGQALQAFAAGLRLDPSNNQGHNPKLVQAHSLAMRKAREDDLTRDIESVKGWMGVVG